MLATYLALPAPLFDELMPIPTNGTVDRAAYSRHTSARTHQVAILDRKKRWSRAPSRYTGKHQATQPIGTRVPVLKHGLTRDSFKEVLKEISSADIAIRKENMECLVPPTSQNPDHDDMNNCHVIGRRWLGHTRQGGMLLSWRTSTRQIAHLIQETVLDMEPGTRIKGQMMLPPLERFTPRPTPDEECKYTVACHNHDSNVYRKADRTGADLDSPEVQFLLGFRGLSSYVAWDRANKMYVSDQFRTSPSIRRKLRKIPELKQLAKGGLIRAERTIEEEVALENELKAWQELYENHQYGAFLSTRTSAASTIAMTGCGPLGKILGHIVIGTLLTAPGQKRGGPSKTEVILTCRAAGSAGQMQLQKENLRLRARAIARTIERGKSVEAIVQFATDWEFYYVSAQDYQRKFDKDEREAIERKIAEARLQPLVDATPVPSD